MKIGYFLATEEFGPAQLLAQAQAAERAGFEALWISDHYHPWTDTQGESPFVWSMIGALSQACQLPITTAVTCPTMRIHPAVLAQAAATSSVLTGDRFVLGVGSGEALNELIFGDAWPSASVRLEMLEEAVTVMRELWSGRMVNFRGRHYTVSQARLYTLPDRPPPVYVSAFGPKAVQLAGRIGDGFISVAPQPEPVAGFREHGGGGKPAQGSFKACYAPDEQEAVQLAHRLWPNVGLPGELAQVLATPRHVEQAASLVTAEQVRDTFVCGPDPEEHRRRIQAYTDAGYDEVYVANSGPYHEGFFELYAKEILPRLH
ncbi:TIGR03557 family F420-dependent LLM class oxidoreductase [Natronosporangium hydrolyticum]|uniref:TIGR03557 family F420-dependent LLM class oxidoreductase n=1 Tax=Natronosporangium hydrolyticum TaxID=2811111 RepID=A0A895YEU5_9ACTN|nr:TIGR03557 family F420-dependent LLM class oxidoreductase [Natronosporangium hydrolyticum]QSB13056.1 TIGR03557 family F420-dependent LLM class oxidoreductase [Natronosporangium hydrolyticum]